MRKFRNFFLMIWFLVHLIITPYQFGAFLMPLRPLLNQSRQPPKALGSLFKLKLKTAGEHVFNRG